MQYLILKILLILYFTSLFKYESAVVQVKVVVLYCPLVHPLVENHRVRPPMR
jgi:hypothetical protein